MSGSLRETEAQLSDIRTFLTEHQRPIKIVVEVREPELPSQLQLPPNTVDPFQSQIAESYLYGGLARKDLPRWAGRSALLYLGGAHLLALVFAALALLQSLSDWISVGTFPLVISTLGELLFVAYSTIVLRFVWKHGKRHL